MKIGKLPRADMLWDGFSDWNGSGTSQMGQQSQKSCVLCHHVQWENQILNTGNGFYIDENGTAVSDYTAV